METRSASQILFGYLPEQTVDVRGGIWKVVAWQDAIEDRNVDNDALVAEVCRLAHPWHQQSVDGNFVEDLTLGRSRLKVFSLNRGRGVSLEPFPRIWICKNCNRLGSSPDGACKCGHNGKRGQLHFVGYCDACGSLKEPWVRPCPNHHQVKVTWPGTASGAEIAFSCPICDKVLQKGFGYGKKCDCGNGTLSYTVHRAASVFSPRAVVIVNPPSEQRMRALEAGGGATRALEWVVEGMPTEFAPAGTGSSESLRRQLQQQGFSQEIIDGMVAVAEQGGAVAPAAPQASVLPENIGTQAEAQALTIALGMSDGRITFDELVRTARAGSELLRRYGTTYREAAIAAGLERVDFVDSFPVLTGHFGYTRGRFEPGQSRLRAFRNKEGDYVVYGETAETEALFIKLSAEAVANWLSSRGHTVKHWTCRSEAHKSVLAACGEPGPSSQPSASEDLMLLIHSYAHRFIRIAALHAGIERNSLSELLVPLHFGFFMYAAARGDFVLGGLQAVFETEMDSLLHDFVAGDHRCPLDPGCSRGGGACVACLHLGEPSCRHFNMKLTRDVLFGANGYLRQLRSS